jgi:transcriptional regulator with XRE-family HTH domain
MTLAELSERSGVPLSSLSKLELGQLSLTYEKLMRLSRALEADFDYIMQDERDVAPPPGRRALVRAGGGERTRWGPHRALVSAADLLSKAFLPVVLEVNARSLADHGPLVQLESEAYLMVLIGTITLHAESYAPLRMMTGDGIYFDGRMPHAILSNEVRPARVLLVAPANEAAFNWTETTRR